MAHLYFLNKNLFRKYPFQATANLTDVLGQKLPFELIANLSISTTVALSNIYVIQVVLNQGYLALTIAHYDNDSGTSTVLGMFSGTVSSDFQTLTFTPYIPYVSGYFVAGVETSANVPYIVYNFSYASTVLEPSTIFCYTPPPVTSLNNQTQRITGNVTFGSLVNLTLTTSELPVNNFELAVIDTTSIESLVDVNSQFRNCSTPCILSINNAVPYSPDDSPTNNNNIYIIGVEPIVFVPDLPTNSINVTTVDTTIATICAASASVLPPVNPLFVINSTPNDFTGVQNYYTRSQTPVLNFMENNNPEYLIWPNFTSVFQVQYANAVDGTYQLIVSAEDAGILTEGQTATISLIRMDLTAGTANVLFLTTGNQVIGDIPLALTTDGAIFSPLANSTFSASDYFSITVSDISTTADILVSIFYTINQS